MKPYIFLIDFDGTISRNDSTTAMGRRYIPRYTEDIVSRFKREEISVKTYIQSILENLNISEEEFRKGMKEEMVMDPTFVNFIQSKHPYRIVSSGSDKNIIYSLEILNIQIPIKNLYTNHLHFFGNHAILEFPHYDEENGVDKSRIIQQYKEKGYTTIFIGDGPSDFEAAGVADYTFVISGSKLETICIKNYIKYYSVKDFDSVLEVFLDTIHL